ncbi:MAG: broad specificity phosphatase PhoE [Alphaproteobacteria bacterium]
MRRGFFCYYKISTVKKESLDMDNVDRFIFVRHGQTDLNAQYVLQFHIDEPLNQKGREQARQAASLLNKFKGTCLFISSPLKRAASTAQIMQDSWLEHLGETAPHKPIANEDLKERFGGSLEGINHSKLKELKAKHIPEGLEPWDNLHLICPKVETSESVVKRMKKAILNGHARAQKQSSTLVIIGHSSAFAAFTRNELGFECITKNAMPYMVEKINGKWQAQPFS